MKMNAIKKLGRASVLAMAFAVAASPAIAQQAAPPNGVTVIQQPLVRQTVTRQPTADRTTHETAQGEQPTVQNVAPVAPVTPAPVTPAAPKESHHGFLKTLGGLAVLFGLSAGAFALLRRRKNWLPDVPRTGEFHPTLPAPKPAAPVETQPQPILVPTAPVTVTPPVVAPAAPPVETIPLGTPDDTAPAAKPKKFEI